MKFLQPQAGTQEAGTIHSWQGAVCRGMHSLECEAKEAAYKAAPYSPSLYAVN